MTDTELIQQILSGNSKAFETLVKTYQDFVVRTAFAYLKNSNDANDIAQEVFVTVYENLHKFRGEANIKTWICRITINKAINELRKNKIRSLFQHAGSLFADKANRAEDPENPHLSLHAKQQNEYIETALAQLPENQKTAFILHKFDELPQQEIAQIMGLSVPAVESLVHRAKVNLQKKLAFMVKI